MGWSCQLRYCSKHRRSDSAKRLIAVRSIFAPDARALRRNAGLQCLVLWNNGIQPVGVAGFAEAFMAEAAAAEEVPNATLQILDLGCNVVGRDGAEALKNVLVRQAAPLHTLGVADTALGGLQKDPTRPESNWKIVKKEGATSVSYDHLKRLNQHTANRGACGALLQCSCPHPTLFVTLTLTLIDSRQQSRAFSVRNSSRQSQNPLGLKAA